jgi:hypothetical protein
MLIDLINNLAITTAFLFIGGKFFENKSRKQISSPKSRLFVGVGDGILGILLMANTIHVSDNVIVDLRHLPIILAALYGGPMASILASIIIYATFTNLV